MTWGGNRPVWICKIYRVTKSQISVDITLHRLWTSKEKQTGCSHLQAVEQMLVRQTMLEVLYTTKKTKKKLADPVELQFPGKQSFAGECTLAQGDESPGEKQMKMWGGGVGRGEDCPDSYWIVTRGNGGLHIGTYTKKGKRNNCFHHVLWNGRVAKWSPWHEQIKWEKVW